MKFLCALPTLVLGAMSLSVMSTVSAQEAAPPPPPPAPAFHQWAKTPPMGWNSWDCFGVSVTEAQTRAQADVMAAKLARFGWQYITVDHQWYEPQAHGFTYRQEPEVVHDQFGRLNPATNRFPSARDGAGFKPLADYVHGKGLKFGIHLMRGIPRWVVGQNPPIKGTPHHAADIADKAHLCGWNGDMYGVDMSKPGAQEYYDSVFEMLAGWGVDLVKVDDLSRPYAFRRAEVEAIRRAIDKTGRPIVLSMSPGETPVGEAAHAIQHANMWRVSDDFWDEWPALLSQFERLRKWAPSIGEGHWPDADMLPLGIIRYKDRTRFSPDEQRTLMTLWSIARSPLIMGGDLARLDDWTLSLLTNEEIIAVNQASRGNRQLFNRDGLVAWVADAPDGGGKCLALFNTRDGVEATVEVPLSDLGFAGEVRVRDLWKRQDLAETTPGKVAASIPAHSARLYRVTAAK